MNCKKCAAIMEDYLENNLPSEILIEVHQHLDSCDQCKIFFNTYRLTVTLSRKMQEPCCVAPDMMERLKAFLFERLNTEK
ncbi:MAG: zf-HC2 domain-containing protein [Deltaproteobacteria bacterium]|nr:zf-HC2 domain-containing protein [Deltaproteobacteria bacterium]